MSRHHYHVSDDSNDYHGLVDSEPLFSELPDCNLSVLGNHPGTQQDSQPFDDETQCDTYCDDNLDNEDNHSRNTEVLLSPTENDNYTKKDTFTQTEENIENQKNMDIDDNEQTGAEEGNNEENSVFCANCMFDKELDRRNYYFGNLLIGELQFLQPCMRSTAHIEILKYVNSLKKTHRNDQRNYKLQD